jgi:hypothetical protein
LNFVLHRTASRATGPINKYSAHLRDFPASRLSAAGRPQIEMTERDEPNTSWPDLSAHRGFSRMNPSRSGVEGRVGTQSHDDCIDSVSNSQPRGQEPRRMHWQQEAEVKRCRRTALKSENSHRARASKCARPMGKQSILYCKAGRRGALRQRGAVQCSAARCVSHARQRVSRHGASRKGRGRRARH